nr:ribonuclease H-like domain-containing protein [Tanacetum cinerariifolium]
MEVVREYPADERTAAARTGLIEPAGVPGEYSTSPDDSPSEDIIPKRRNFYAYESTRKSTSSDTTSTVTPKGRNLLAYVSTRKSTNPVTASTSGREENAFRFGSMPPPPYIKTESTKKSIASDSTFEDSTEERKLYGFRSMAHPYIKTDLTKKVTAWNEKVAAASIPNEREEGSENIIDEIVDGEKVEDGCGNVADKNVHEEIENFGIEKNNEVFGWADKEFVDCNIFESMVKIVDANVKSNLPNNLFVKTYAKTAEKVVLNKNLFSIHTCKKDNGDEVVVFNEEIVEEGSKKWLNTICGYFVGCNMNPAELRYNIRRMLRRFGLYDTISNGNSVWLFKFRIAEGGGKNKGKEQAKENSVVNGKGKVNAKARYMYVPKNGEFRRSENKYFVLADDEDNETIKEEFVDSRLEVDRMENANDSESKDDLVCDENEATNNLNAHGMFLPFVISDHSPDVVTIPEGLKKRRSFRFINYIANKDEFADYNETIKEEFMDRRLEVNRMENANDSESKDDLVCEKNEATNNLRCSNAKYSTNSCRILVRWNPNQVSLMIVHTTKQAIFCIVESLQRNVKFFRSFIYASNSGRERQELWALLQILKNIANQRPWILMRDFNVTLKTSEHSAGGSCMNGYMIDYNECVNSLELEDICSFGFQFIRTKSLKNPNSSIMRKHDRIMINEEFLQQFQNAHGMFLPFVISDHSPAVANAASILNEYVVASNEELKLFHQKAKLKWLSEGDQNTAYFHGILKSRKHKGRIESICDENGKRFKEDNVASVFVEHFKKFLGTKHDVQPLESIDVIFDNVLSKKEAEDMIGIVTSEEIKEVVFDIDSNKASGEINATLIALVPKVDVPSKVSEFRPITCCNGSNSRRSCLFIPFHLNDGDLDSVEVIKQSMDQCSSISGLLPNIGKVEKLKWLRSRFCMPKDQGGLGIKSVKNWNEVLPIKKLWKIIEAQTCFLIMVGNQRKTSDSRQIGKIWKKLKDKMRNVRNNNVLKNIVNSLALYKAKRNLERVRIVSNNLESSGCDCTLLVLSSLQFGLGRKLDWINEIKSKSKTKMTRKRIEIIKRKRNAMEMFLTNDVADLLRNNLDSNAYNRSCLLMLTHLSPMSKGKEQAKENSVDNGKGKVNAKARYMYVPKIGGNKRDLKCATRNIRGMYTDDKQKEVKELIFNENLYICAVLETHLKENKRNVKFFCSFIYASNSGREKQELWALLEVHKNIASQRPWILMRDFNVTLKTIEHSAGGSCMNGYMIDFNECLDSLELEDICNFGFQFMWTKSLKNPNSSIIRKLDRIMINEEFLQQFQNVHGMFLRFESRFQEKVLPFAGRTHHETGFVFKGLFHDCLTAVNEGVMVFLVGRCHGGVPVKMTGVTGDKHLCSGTVSSDLKKKVQGCSDVRENGRKGSIKAGGFGFGSLAVERKRYKRVALFSWSVESPLGTSLIGKRYGCQGLFLSQKKYAVEILKKAHMVNCNPSRTHVDTESKLGVDGDPVSDLTLYRSLACSLQYLTFTRPDISYACGSGRAFLRYRIWPKKHRTEVKRAGEMTYFLHLSQFWLHILMWIGLGFPLLEDRLQEAKYRGVANAVAETCWLPNLLRELHTYLSSVTLVYCDNVNVVYLSCNPVQYQRTKHIEIDIHFVYDLVATGQVRVLHVPSRYQFADIFTKGLSLALFEEFVSLQFEHLVAKRNSKAPQRFEDSVHSIKNSKTNKKTASKKNDGNKKNSEVCENDTEKDMEPNGSKGSDKDLESIGSVGLGRDGCVGNSNVRESSDELSKDMQNDDEGMNSIEENTVHKSYASMVKNDEVPKNLNYIPTLITDSGNEVVIFDEALVSKGSER